MLSQILINAGYIVDVVSASLSEERAKKLGIRQLYREQYQVNKKYFAIFDAVSGENAACIQDRIPAPIDPAFTRTISYHEIALGALHDFGDINDWNALMQNGEALLERVAKGHIDTSVPITFKFGQMPEALEHSEFTKLKTVISLS
ncbi:hypothetical protein [Shewanella youngdeokensis]|uniref:Uncharacterized protein n=1 Tax=Shewanella youngdeokensis TaxID=2999068 RepID=A0ABZ0JTR7_9GAMM|nr:hypothetical protein RGE70_09545 [Shewanella sp. DAU334]